MASNIKTRIMRRVYGIWFVRRVVPTVATFSFFTYIVMTETAEKFFVAKVLSNFFAVASHVWSIPGFVGAAVLHADPSTLFVISFSILAGFIMGVRLLRDIRTVVSRGIP